MYLSQHTSIYSKTPTMSRRITARTGTVPTIDYLYIPHQHSNLHVVRDPPDEPDQLRQFIYDTQEQLLLRDKNPAYVAQAFGLVADLVSNITPRPSGGGLRNDFTVLPLSQRGQTKALLPHPALPIVLECTVAAVYNHQYPAHHGALEQRYLEPFATLKEFRNCHRQKFQRTRTDGPPSHPRDDKPSIAARSTHKTYTVQPPEDSSDVNQTTIFLKATHVHFRVPLYMLEYTEPNYIISDTGRVLTIPNTMSYEQVKQRTEERNYVAYDTIPDDQNPVDQSMQHPERGPHSQEQPSWNTALLTQDKPPGTPLLPNFFNVSESLQVPWEIERNVAAAYASPAPAQYTIPLPALLDDLTHGKNLILCAEEHDFHEQHALFVKNTNIRSSQESVLDDPRYAHLLEPHAPETLLPLNNIPPTDLESPRFPDNRLLDFCLQPQRYLPEPPDTH